MSWSPDDEWLGIYGPSGDQWNIYRLKPGRKSKNPTQPGQPVQVLQYYLVARRVVLSLYRNGCDLSPKGSGGRTDQGYPGRDLRGHAEMVAGRDAHRL